MKELKCIKGTKKRYMISVEGWVYSLYGRDNKLRSEPFILKTTISAKGYEYIKLRIKGVLVNRRVHRLVAQAFIPNPDDLETVNHIDGDKLNNHVANLEWCSIEDNNIKGKAQYYTFINPDGLKVTFYHMRKFCKDNNLDSSCMHRVLSGKAAYHKGWRSYIKYD